MWRCWSLAILGAIAILLIPAYAGFGQDGPPPMPSPTPLGFSPGTRAAETEAETHALAVPNPNSARSLLRTLTEEPHVAGTPADHKTALFVRDKLREWGWKADLAEYEVLLNYPTAASLQLLRPTEQVLPLKEAMLAIDKDSASPDAFPAFHGYGVSGCAVGQVVYANYGRPEDFAALEKMGVEVKDKVVLVRYGELFRGLKVRNAQQRGARGILIYSDPADDGYARGDVFPSGHYRPESAIQRGSVQFLSLQPGDPSTPGGPSIKGTKRLPIDPYHGFPLNPDPDRPSAGGPDFGGAGERVLSIEQWEKETGLKRAD